MSSSLHREFDTAISAKRRVTFRVSIMAAVAFAAVALAYYGRDATAEYRFQSAIVQSIAQIPGRDLSDRQLIVEIDGGLRALSDRNRLEIAHVGAAICVRRSRDIFGFVRYSIWPKGFCLNN